MNLFKNNKLEKIKENISSDFSTALETAYKLPLLFAEPKQIGFRKYKTDIFVIENGGKMYPFDIFAGIVVEDETKKVEVALLKSEFESLYNWVGKFDGNIVYGIKLDQKVGKYGIGQLLKKLDIIMDTKNMTYELGEAKLYNTLTSSPVRQ